MSLTRGNSCMLCQQRKVRCDQQKPCSGCVRAQVECKVAPIQPPRRKKRKTQEVDLIDRLKRYEALMTQNGVNFSSILDNDRERNASEMASDIQNPSPGPVSPKTADSRGVNRKKYELFRFITVLTANVMTEVLNGLHTMTRLVGSLIPYPALSGEFDRI